MFGVHMSLLWSDIDVCFHPINISLLWSEESSTARFYPPEVSRYNDPHLLPGPQNFQTPRFTGNSIVHTSWCKES